jgi:hypothetical protein
MDGGSNMDENLHELNITELRLKKRPLWMSDLGIEDYSDFIGGGGDIYTDRLPPAWARHEGMDLSADEEKELGPIDVESFRETKSAKAAETVTEKISGIVDSLKNIFKGEEEKEK